MGKILVIGLTGGIACGKTTVAKMFQSLGAYVVDADLVGHQILMDDANVKRHIIEAFGESILNDNGQIDRSKLGSIVFNNPDQLRLLNEIIHPPIIEAINAEVDKKLTSGEYKAIVLDVALLIECNMTHSVDYVVLVYANEDVQIQRLIQRGLLKKEAEKRILSQMPFEEKKHFADFVIYNDGTLSDTEKQVNRIWDELLSGLE